MGAVGPVLLVTHDDEVRRTLVQFLRHFWFRVRPAANGDDAFTQLAKRPAPQLVLLDLNTPGLSSPDFQPFLHLCDEMGEVPFIFLSPPGELEDGWRLNLVQQPLDVLELLRALERQLRPEASTPGPFSAPPHPTGPRFPGPFVAVR